MSESSSARADPDRAGDAGPETRPDQTDPGLDTGGRPGGGDPPDGGPDRRSRGPRRPLWLLVLCLVIAAGALWGASRLAWSVDSVPARGSDAVPELVPLALAALAALAAQFAGSPVVKRVIAGLILLSAAYLVYRLSAGAGPVDTGAGGAAAAQTHVSVQAAQDQEPWAIGLVGLAVVTELFAAVLLFTAARVLPTMGSRYTRKPRVVDPDQRMWEALSDGEDPTSR